MEYYCTSENNALRHYRIIILLNFHTNSELAFQWKCSGFERGLVRETIATQSNSPPDLSSESLWSLVGSLFSGKCNEISSVGRLFVVRRRIRVSVDLWSMAFVSRSFCTDDMNFIVEHFYLWQIMIIYRIYYRFAFYKQFNDSYYNLKWFNKSEGMWKLILHIWSGFYEKLILKVSSVPVFFNEKFFLKKIWWVRTHRFYWTF